MADNLCGEWERSKSIFDGGWFLGGKAEVSGGLGL